MLFSAHSKPREVSGATPQQFPLTPTPVDAASAQAPTTDAYSLMDMQTGPQPVVSTTDLLSPALSLVAVATSPLRKTVRQPVVIRGTGKKSMPAVPGAKGKRPLFVVGAVFAALLVVLTALAYTVPVGKDGKALLTLGGVGNSKISMTSAKSNDAGIDIASQAVTATAITAAGSTGVSYTAYDGTIPAANADEAAHLAKFAPGNCTYWANYRYHQLTGVWVPWLGNAYEWYYQAINYGWHTSSYPSPNGTSILVMAPYTMGNGALGHVAVVESVNASAGTATVSSWNWGPQNWGVTTYMDVPYPMDGLEYVWV